MFIRPPEFYHEIFECTSFHLTLKTLNIERQRKFELESYLFIYLFHFASNT